MTTGALIFSMIVMFPDLIFAARYQCEMIWAGTSHTPGPTAGAFDRAARLAAIPAGESPANRRSPVTVVDITSNGEGDQSVESLVVKVPEGWVPQPDPCRGASNLAGRSGSEPVKLPFPGLTCRCITLHKLHI
jgi:hypothetical protein